MSAVIKVSNLSKQYRLGQVGTGTISHDVNRWWHKIRGKEDPYLKIGESNDRTVKGESDYVWALKDINFVVEQGEVLGIIGRNGAGKSTLLKILSRTTSPTTGSVKLKGRVASLLEVGTGFHPELSGRDNIYLNGAILGMTRQEIKSKFDEIVDFAGVERYIDTPVKRYSSGMYVRLAFGVAAHLESEILIVDEVLAVGDAEFQKKALGKIKQVSIGEGRTVIFVSHQMEIIRQLTSRTINMRNGLIFNDGQTPSIIVEYLSELNGKHEEYKFNRSADVPSFEKIEVLTSLEDGIHEFGKSLKIILCIHSPKPLSSLELSFRICSKFDDSTIVYNWYTTSNELSSLKGQNGLSVVDILIPSFKLYKGEYYFRFHLTDPLRRVVFEEVNFIFPIEVIMGGLYNEWGFGNELCRYIEDTDIKISFPNQLNDSIG